MQNNANICEVLKKLKPLSEKLKPFAAKYGVSAQAIILLYAISQGADLYDFFMPEFYDELKKGSLIEENSCNFKITGKGAIIAKSIGIYIEKFEN